MKNEMRSAQAIADMLRYCNVALAQGDKDRFDRLEDEANGAIRFCVKAYGYNVQADYRQHYGYTAVKVGSAAVHVENVMEIIASSPMMSCKK